MAKTAGVLRGRVVSGARKAAFFTCLDWVTAQCLDKLGFSPSPGTLNVELLPDCLAAAEALPAARAVELVPPDPDYCRARAIPAVIRGISAAVIVPQESVRVHGKSILEIIAPVNLRAALNLSDDDILTVVLTPTPPHGDRDG